MKNFPVICIWEGCDPTVAEAIAQFQGRWRPYSASSRRYPIVRLIQEVIDPAVTAYVRTLPQRYWSYIQGAGTEVTLSGIIRLVGFNATARVQRWLLRSFVSTEAGQSARDTRFIATLESLLDLVRACARKSPIKPKVHDRPLNGRRIEGDGFCRFCGAFAELTAFANESDDLKTDDPEEMLRLSNLYCSDHRPKFPGGEWNPAYRKAKRSLAQFDIELDRLSRQSGNWRVVQAQSGDPLVDSYIFHYVREHDLRPADEAELRHHARWMADGKLSDRKKQMVMLQMYGASQSEIARKLGIERQAVFKALTAIPSIFRKITNLPGFPSYFLRQP